MKRTLEDYIRILKDAGFTVEIVDAPPSAQTFDKIIITYTPEKTIRKVTFYSSKENKIVGDY